MTDRTALSAALAGFPERLAVAARSASGRPVPDGEWTPEQVVRHLIAVETDVHQARLHDLATIDDPRWDWTEPGPWPGAPGLDLDGLLARFGALRRGTLDTLARLDDAGWARTGTHARLGVWDVAGLVRNAIDHDGEHLAGLTG
jgi:DinB family protein